MNRVPSSIVRGVALGAAAVALAAQQGLAAPGLGTTIGVGPSVIPTPVIDPTPHIAIVKYSPERLDMGELASYKGDQRTCPGCDAEVGVHSRACRHCGYRFGRT